MCIRSCHEPSGGGIAAIYPNSDDVSWVSSTLRYEGSGEQRQRRSAGPESQRLTAPLAAHGSQAAVEREEGVARGQQSPVHGLLGMPTPESLSTEIGCPAAHFADRPG